MTSNLVRSARRVVLTVVIAGAASVAVAPAAFASPDSMPSTSNFIIGLHGEMVRVPFFCDEDNLNKQHNICIDAQTAARF